MEESLLDQIRTVYTQSNHDARKRQKIQEQLRDLQRELYTDWELVFSISCGPLQYALLKFGYDLSIFESLSNSTSATPLTLSSLVQSTGAAPRLLSHYLRAMAAFGFIQETNKECFAANRVTRVLAQPNVVGAEVHMSGVHIPVAQAIPSYLKTHKYQDISSTKDLPFQQALKTDLEPFEWMKQRPEQMKSLGHAMALDEVHSWVFSYPIEEEVGSFVPGPESALLVDIGGGFGQHSVFLKNKFPHLPGRIVVQDVPATLAHAPKVEGIEFSAYDFFTPQPIRGAKFYYMRHVLHDWSDEECVKILSNIIPAMGPESLIVIEELVLPETNMPWQVAMMDILMNASLGGVERTREDWEKLMHRAGLSIVKVHIYDDVKYNGVITAVPKAA